MSGTGGATMDEYGERVKAARRAAGLTLRELGARVGVDFTSLSHLEHGRFAPSVGLGLRLSDALGVDLVPPGDLARERARVERLRAVLTVVAQQAHGAHGGRGSFRWCGENCCRTACEALGNPELGVGR